MVIFVSGDHKEEERKDRNQFCLKQSFSGLYALNMYVKHLNSEKCYFVIHLATTTAALFREAYDFVCLK